MPYCGYAGNILYVDLTSGQTRAESLDMELARKFLGGCGLGSKLFYDIAKPGAAPLSPDNPIIISAGPLIGTGTPQGSKIQLITKSPTPAHKEESRHYVGWSSGGSHRFGAMMKKAGYDQIVITGRAETPVYLRITDDDVKICRADDLWGRDIYETTEALQKRHDGSGVIAIGKAGENMVSFAVAFVDGLNTIGRNGGAAVMGSKNLKAIVVRGTKGVTISDPSRFRALSRSVNEKARRLPLKSSEGAGVRWRLGRKWAPLYPQEIYEQTLSRVTGCDACPTPCKGIHRVEGGQFAGTTLRTSIFQFVPVYGRRLELEDYRDSMKLYDYANRLGICLVTSLDMIRLICALYRRGVLGKSDIDGLEVKWGDVRTYMALLEKIANRDGIGDIMAQGWYGLSSKVARSGVDVDTDWDSGPIAKGTSVLVDARFRTLQPGIFAALVNPRGGMHMHPITYYADQPISTIKQFCADSGMSREAIERVIAGDGFNCGRFAKHVEDGEAVCFALGVCTNLIVRQVTSLKLLADFYQAVTGIQLGVEELKMAGERIWNLYKLINVREGFTRADDLCPGLWARTIDEPIKTSGDEIRLKDYFGRPITHAWLEQMLDDYYDEHGWDIKTGTPTSGRLRELGLQELA